MAENIEAVPRPGLGQVDQTGLALAALAVAFARTAAQGDPTFVDRFVTEIEHAYRRVGYSGLPCVEAQSVLIWTKELLS
jgi:hypothetical protein